MKKLIFLMVFPTIMLAFGCSEEIGTSNENASHGVNMANVEEFKSELSNKLPNGTPVDDVLKELKRLDLEHTYVQAERTVFAIVPRVGEFRGTYDTSLLIRVHLNADERVDHIEYLLEHTGL